MYPLRLIELKQVTDMFIPASVQNSGCLYLHGFLSSPASEKAQQMMALYQEHPELGSLSTPFVHFSPTEAMALAESQLLELKEKHDKVWLVGSSLGGFYATWLAEKYEVPAVLINPAVRPFDLFRHYLGEHKHYHNGETYLLEAHHLDELEALHCADITHPKNLLLLLQTADETLDYRHAAELYRQCPAWVEGGGTHSFDGFIDRVPQMLGHLSRCLG
ncbi:MAG: esterase YqiA [Oceanobacter sp.]|jgi:predicted esterase YcpF (UPF0227 family)|nr:MAG: esterase YqiA [Oceanobacter sp.]